MLTVAGIVVAVAIGLYNAFKSAAFRTKVTNDINAVQADVATVKTAIQNAKATAAKDVSTFVADVKKTF